MDNLSLYHDGGLRCPKCVALVQRLAEVGNTYLDDDLEDLPGHMYGKKASKFPKQKRHYEPDSLCNTCKSQILSGQYHKLGDHIVEAHEAIGKEDMMMPSEGCCWFCLLLIQFKCKNGCLQSANAPSQDQRPLSLGLSWFWNLQIFSSSIDEPLRIDRYLPQGLQHEETESMRIVPWKTVYWPMVKSWLQNCEDDHAKCNQQPLLLSSVMMVRDRIFIDVHHQNLVTRQYNCRYVALSYVWGGIPQLLLTRSNAEALFRTGGLKGLGNEIPQVIRDAMQVVSSIGEELLWVDSLCIVQDDEPVKDQLISDMASIYSSALVTIVAANGKNANSGLAGVCEGSRVSQDVVDIPGTGLSVTYWSPLDLALDGSTYNTRGWTFQERLLSRRCLYFTKTQIFLECQQYLHSEDRTGKQEGPYPSSTRTPQSGNFANRMLLGLQDSENKKQTQILRYIKLVEQYCQRKFTFPNDILKAFAGIESAMEEDLCGWTMLYGLPQELLDEAILWEPGRPRAVPATTNPARFFNAAIRSIAPVNHTPIQLRSSEFPSWSWAAWIGDICYDELIATDLVVYHSHFKLVHASDNLSSQAPLNKQTKPSVLSFTSKCLPGSVISLRNTICRDKHTCVIVNRQGYDVGTIPGVQDAFAEEYDSTSVDIVLLSWSKNAVHRFRSLEDMGYPSVFNIRYSREQHSILTIMFVRWNEGYARRLALGYIHRDAWEEAGPTSKNILLA